MKKSLLATAIPMSLMTATHSRQRNSDIFDCSDIGGHFKSRFSSHICFADGDDTPPAEATLSFSSQADLDAYIAKVTADKKPDEAPSAPEDKGESITERREREAREAATKSAEQGVFKNAVLFETQFDGVMKNAAKFFPKPESVKTIRDDVTETDTVKRASMMAATAAKEFFSNQKNIDILEKSDQEIVKSEISNKRFETDIDGMKAWTLMNRAIYNHELKNKHDAMRDNSGAGNGQYGYEKLDASLKAFYPESVVAL